MYIAIGIIAVVLIWFIVTYNSFISLKAKVKESFSTMDVFLKKRYDLIPNLVETVKGYTSHEKDTLEEVVRARNSAISTKNVSEKLKNEGELTNALSRLLMLQENYPNLKADTQFINLQDSLNKIEDEIERSRRYYNGVVRKLNEKVKMIPSCIIASIMNINEEPYFEIEDTNERNNVKVKF